MDSDMNPTDETGALRGVSLRPYQDEAIAQIETQVTGGHRRVLLTAPTGSGKTVMFAALAATYHARGLKVLVVAHRKELIDQAVKKLRASGIDSVGVYRGVEGSFNRHAAVQVASIQALKPGLIEADLVIVDEAHHSPADSYARLLELYPDAVHIGATATPWWGDSKGLGDYFQTIVIAATVRELIDAGYLAKIRVFTHPHTLSDLDLRGIKTMAGDYAIGSVSECMSKPKLLGNIVDHWSRHAQGMRTLCFASSVEHSQLIVARFVEVGVAAEHVDGKTPDDERDAILGRLRSGETLIVSNFNVLTEGFDAPEVGCIILARPTKRVGVYLQAVGRGFRPSDLKENVTVLDHAGSCLMHGLPDADRVVTLSGLEKAAATKTGLAPIRYCPKCGFMVSSGIKTCPECRVMLRGEVETEEPTGVLVEAISDGVRGTLLTLNGRTMTVAAWSRELGINELTIHARIRRGSSDAECLVPARKIDPEMFLTVDGRAQSLGDWSRETKVARNTIRRRLELGYSPKESMQPATNELKAKLQVTARMQKKEDALKEQGTHTLGERLSLARAQKRWSQSELATHSGVSCSTISGIELGVRNADRAMLAKLSRALDVELDLTAPPNSVGALVRDIRVRRGWKPKELANRCGISTDTVFNIETGREGMPETIAKLSNVLGVDLKSMPFPNTTRPTRPIACECGYCPKEGEVLYAIIVVDQTPKGRWGKYLRATYDPAAKRCGHVIELENGNMDCAIQTDRARGLRAMEVPNL